jgi:hypothetical protein
LMLNLKWVRETSLQLLHTYNIPKFFKRE